MAVDAADDPDAADEIAQRRADFDGVGGRLAGLQIATDFEAVAGQFLGIADARGDGAAADAFARFDERFDHEGDFAEFAVEQAQIGEARPGGGQDGGIEADFGQRRRVPVGAGQVAPVGEIDRHGRLRRQADEQEWEHDELRLHIR